MNGTQIGTATKFAPMAKVLVDIDKLNCSKKIKLNDRKINIDLSNFIKIFDRAAKKIKIEKKWYEIINHWKIKYPTVKKQYFKEKYANPYVFFNKLSKFTKKNDIIIPDASANLVWFYQAYKPKNQKIFTALNHSPMDILLRQQLELLYL